MNKIGSLFYKPKKNDKEISEKRWNVASIIWRAITKTCTVIGAMILISAIISTFLIMSASDSKKPLPNDMVLVFNIEEGITEVQTRPTFLEPFPFARPTLRNVVDTIDKAKDDKRVRGIIFNIKGGGINMAHIQELRAVIHRFKESGKFAKIYSASYVDGSSGMGRYYLASAFDEIWMQPVGMLSMSGINMEVPFASDALSKIGVTAQFFKREKFKSAMESFTNSEISPANKEMLRIISENLSEQMLYEISVDRDIGDFTIKKHRNKGILTGKEALEAKLIDRLDYPDVLVSEIREAATGDPDDNSVKLISLARYSQDKIKVTPKVAKTKKSVALIYIVGTIVDTSGAKGSAAADEIAGTITKAYEDDDIKAIVLRIDSPGGSPSASETIHRAIVKAQEKGKKVIVSMGSVAASGGYWVAANADAIYASSGTLTGSIGVVMGKFELSGLWKKMGVNWSNIQVGENADIWSINEPFDKQGAERMNVLIDDVYNTFIERVSKGRGLDKEAVRRIAQGRAFTGHQARAVGLIDDLGGLDYALERTAVILGGHSSKELNVIRMPRDLGALERLMEIFGQEVGLGFNLSNSNVMRQLQTFWAQVKLFDEGPNYAVYDPDLEALR